MPTEPRTIEDLFPFIEAELREEGVDPEIEAEKRVEAPDLYDCAVAIWELDRPDLVAELLARGTFGVDDLTPRSHQPLLFLSISRSRVASFRLLTAAGADVRRGQAEKDYLFWAVFGDADPAIVEMLLARGLEVTAEHLEVAKRRAKADVVAVVERALAEGTAGLRRDVDAVRVPRSEAPALAAGVAIEVVAGAFQRTRGTVVEVLPSGSVRASLSVFGREVVMELAPTDVAVIG